MNDRPVVLAVDALDYGLVEIFHCENLKQKYRGYTDISEFEKPRTMVLWSSFLKEENVEAQVLVEGKDEMWDLLWPKSETFLDDFPVTAVVDLPGYSYEAEYHEKSRALLGKYFGADSDSDRRTIRKTYTDVAFEHYDEIQGVAHEVGCSETYNFFDLVIVYVSVIDEIGHLDFGNQAKMGMLYGAVDTLALALRRKNNHLLILSDHGMKSSGELGYGIHSDQGYWACSWADLSGHGRPRITEFGEIIRSCSDGNFD